MAWNYQTEVAADSPFIWYRMNETSGTVATDDGSNGEDGTYAGTADQRLLDQPPIIWGAHPGPQGRCVLFNGAPGTADDARIEYAGLTLPDLTTIAIEFWMEAPEEVGGYPCSYAVTGTSAEFAVHYLSAQVFRLYINDAFATLNLLSTSNNMADGRAHHVYIDWDSVSGDARLFLDGARHMTVESFQTGNALTSGGTLMVAQEQDAVGSPVGAATNYGGRLDQFALYSAKLSEERIAIHASAGLIRYADYKTFDLTGPDGLEFIRLTGGSTVYYRNRVFHVANATFVRWNTTEPDSLGASYPGPGVFGVDTSDYCIEERGAL